MLATFFAFSLAFTIADDHQKFWGASNQCGPICLAQISDYFGRPLAIEQVNKLLPPDGKQKSLLDVNDAINSTGLYSYAVQLKSLSSIPENSIALISIPRHKGATRLFHFVVVLRTHEQLALILDGLSKPEWMHSSRLEKVRNSEALIISASPRSTTNYKRIFTRFALGVGGGGLALAIALLLVRKIRQRQTLLSVCSFLLTAICLGCGQGQPKGLVKILPSDSIVITGQVQEARASDGVVKYYSTGEGKFTIANQSASAVRIKELKSSCACASLSLDVHEIPAGKEATLTVHIRGSSIATAAASITCKFDSPTDPIKILQVQLTPTFKPPMLLSGGEVELGGINPITKTARVNVQLAEPKGKGVGCVSVAKTKDPSLTATIKCDKVRTNLLEVNIADYTITVVSNQSQGSYVSFIDLMDDNGANLGVVKLVYSIGPIIEVSPALIFLSLSASDAAEVRRNVIITSHDKTKGLSLSVNAATVPGWARVAVSGGSMYSKDGRVVLEVNIDSKKVPNGRCRASITLSGSADGREIIVPIETEKI